MMRGEELREWEEGRDRENKGVDDRTGAGLRNKYCLLGRRLSGSDGKIQKRLKKSD
jgi:hypothetical protein